MNWDMPCSASRTATLQTVLVATAQEARPSWGTLRPVLHKQRLTPGERAILHCVLTVLITMLLMALILRPLATWLRPSRTATMIRTRRIRHQQIHPPRAAAVERLPGPRTTTITRQFAIWRCRPRAGTNATVVRDAILSVTPISFWELTVIEVTNVLIGSSS